MTTDQIPEVVDNAVAAADEGLSFEAMPLSSQLVRAVRELEYTAATDIQAAAIPYLLDGQDVIGRSSTGTGKTAAFGIPAIECVDGELKRPQVLVLSPTRELALQIAREMQKYAKYKEGVSVATVYGGASMIDQIRALKRANVVIGTPGRLMDHLNRHTLKMNDLKMVVLDEADEMLSMGFIEDIQTILSSAPEERQTVLFSATMPPPILKVSQEFLHDPQVVDVMEQETSQADIEQTYYYVPQHKKQEALSLLLSYADAERSIVFCNTKSMVDDLAVLLRKQGLSVSSLHGDMTQIIRTQVMDNFRRGGVKILIATDVAARGIDVDDVDAVINFDLPQSFEYYIHRIGRTGRAGKHGVSQTLVCNGKQLSILKSLMRFTGSPIKEHQLPTNKNRMERAVAKSADELMQQMQQPAGEAAQMLVKRLLGAAESGITAEQVACVLAEKLLGGDERFKSSFPQEEPKSAAGYAKPILRGTNDEQSPMVTVTANIGRTARVKPKHFVGAIAELLDIPGKSIGKIDIFDNESRIGLREDAAFALTNYGKPIRINGLDVTFSMQRKPHFSRSEPERSFKNNKSKRPSPATEGFRRGTRTNRKTR